VKIGILTSSRADYGIYKPLLAALGADPFFDVRLIVFGSHLLPAFGMTIGEIEADGYTIDHRIEAMPADDSPEGISAAIGKIIQDFSKIWQVSEYDLVFALGDRFEMFAAVVSGLPFNVRFAHIHGGETTKGAIDDAFRHSISLMSSLHFASAAAYKQRIAQITGTEENIYNTGALGMDFINSVTLLSIAEFKDKYDIDLRIPTILSTLHPETVSFRKNEVYADAYVEAMQAALKFQVVITMPNADTFGKIIRNKLHQLARDRPGIHLIENFGSKDYLSCMKYCEMLIGNTSSGFYDASFFPKWVINLGDRQQGRIRTPNILDVPFESGKILEAITSVSGRELPVFDPVYGDGHAAGKIVKILKDEVNTN
jgi:GDP/UDP-N,N'-diacetylbacillosamine 2-epimerase (hydrolysing)